MNRFFALMTVLCMLAPCTAGTKLDDVQPCDENILGLKVIENLLARDYMLYYGGKGLHYSEAGTAVGALRIAENIQDKALIERIIARYETFLEEDSSLISRQPHVDHNVEGIVPLQIYLTTGDERYLEAGLSFADNQWENPREDGLTSQTRWWIDDMYMVGMLQIQAYRATQDIKYADRTALQLTSYINKLQQPNGLFFHGPEFHYHWGRGNGWVAASMAEVLKSLPADHPRRPELMAGYRKMMAALLQFQSDNGMWRQLIDYEYSWAESSCTAMFSYAMTVGVHEGWLDKAAYGPAIEKAWKALCAHVDREGNVREICIGTGQMDDIEFYLKRPRTLGDFHGQAPVLWLINERLEKRNDP
ncbi:MAG: glycoside hydrolase family 88 protein [Sedimentisphaerales bacterium]|nr:glycoside hydrolase family 88 protein [Sedimentisphaerales bacterium]